MKLSAFDPITGHTRSTVDVIDGRCSMKLASSVSASALFSPYWKPLTGRTGASSVSPCELSAWAPYTVELLTYKT